MNKNAEKVRKGLAKQIKRGYNTSIVNSQHIYFMIPGSKGLKSDASLLAGGFLNLGPAKNMSK